MTANPQMHNTLPTASSSFLSDTQTWMLQEEAERYADMFTPFVVSGGIHGTGAGLTATPSAIVAYPGGYYSTETAGITYQDNSTSWVVATYAIDSPLTGSFARVAGTKYAVDAVSVAQPTAPSNSVYLMKVVTSGGAITAVTDLRTLTPIPSGSLSASTVTATGTTTARSFADRFAEVFNVKDFGAVGNGVANDTTAVNAAITAAAAVGGGTVFFPAGTYYTPTGFIMSNYVRYTGAGGYGTSNILTAASHPGLTWVAGTQLSQVEIDHLTFTGPGYAIRGLGTLGTSPSPYDYLAIASIHDNDFSAALAEGIYGNLILCHIDHNDFGWHGTPGVATRYLYSKGDVTGNTSNTNIISNNRFIGSTAANAVYFEAGYSLGFYHNDFETNNNTVSVIKLAGMSSIYFKDLNWFEYNAGATLVQCVNDTTATLGNYVIVFDGNYVNMYTPNITIFDFDSGVGNLTFTNNDGTGWNGSKYITHWNYPAPAYDTGVSFAQNNNLIGYVGSIAAGIHLGQPYGAGSGAITLDGPTSIIGTLATQGFSSVLSGVTLETAHTYYASTGVAQAICPIVSASPGGSGYLVLLNGHTAATTTQTSVYWVSLHYDGTLNSSSKIIGDAQTFGVSAGQITHTGTNGYTYVIEVFRISH